MSNTLNTFFPLSSIVQTCHYLYQLYFVAFIVLFLCVCGGGVWGVGGGVCVLCVGVYVWGWVGVCVFCVWGCMCGGGWGGDVCVCVSTKWKIKGQPVYRFWQKDKKIQYSVSLINKIKKMGEVSFSFLIYHCETLYRPMQFLFFFN